MIIPDYEKIEYTNSHELKINKFYIQGFLFSIFTLGLFLGGYFLFKSIINHVLYFILVFILYIVLSLFNAKKLYNNYQRFFLNDELAISSKKIYYNVCMNISGNYTNIDSNKDLSEISDIYIRNGLNPKSLVICFKDNSHIVIHCVKEIEEVKKIIENKIQKD